MTNKKGPEEVPVQRKIRLKKEPDQTSKERLKKTLFENGHILSHKIEGTSLYIEYDLLQVQSPRLFEMLNAIAIEIDDTFLARIKNTFLNFIEQNKIEQIRFPNGWDREIQKIYTQCHTKDY